VSASAPPSAGFRLLWAGATLLAWAAFGALALHRSGDPTRRGWLVAPSGHAELHAALAARLASAGLAVQLAGPDDLGGVGVSQLSPPGAQPLLRSDERPDADPR
jgi:hypothetical protein